MRQGRFLLARLKTRNLKWACIGTVLICGLAGSESIPAWATNAPVIAPPTGTNSTVAPTATITAEPGAVIRYTTDGTTPGVASPIYSTAIPLGDHNVIKSIAYLAGVPSTVTEAYVDNDPDSLPVPRSGLQLWLKGDFGPVLTAAKVAQWVDLSGNSPPNNANQGTSANQPTVTVDALNGFDAVAFNGTNSYMSLTTGLNNLSSGATILAVIRPETASGAETLYTSSNAGVTDLVSLQTTGTVATGNFNNGATASSVATPSSSLTTNRFQIVDVVHNGAASATISVNGVPKQTGAVQNLATSARSINRIGVNSALTASSYWQGQLAEILVYSRGITASEKAAIIGYLASKYQVLSVLTTPTPIISLPTSTISEPGQVAISAATGATVRVTLDNSTPNGSSPIYLKPLNIYYTTTIKAIAIANGVTSSVATSTITLNATKWPAPSVDSKPMHINLQLPTIAIPQ